LAAGGVIILLVAAPITMGGSIAELMLSLLGACIICFFLAWWLQVRVFESFCVYTLLRPVIIGGRDVGVSVGAGSSPPTGGEPLVSSGAHSPTHPRAHSLTDAGTKSLAPAGAHFLVCILARPTLVIIGAETPASVRSHSLASAGPHCLVSVRARPTLVIIGAESLASVKAHALASAGGEILIIVEGHLAASALAESPAHSGAHCLISTGTETLPLVKAHALASTWAKRLRSAKAIGASCAKSESRPSAKTKTESLASAGAHSPAHPGAYTGAHSLPSAGPHCLVSVRARSTLLIGGEILIFIERHLAASTLAESLASAGTKCLVPAKTHSRACAWAPSLVCTGAHCLFSASDFWAGALLILPVGHCRLPLLRVLGYSTSDAPALSGAASSASAAWASKGLTG